MKPAQPPPSGFQPGQRLQILDDPIQDPYQAREKLSEPAVCSDCGAVYHDGRWQWTTQPANAQQVRCTACRRIHENMPAGYVSIEGQFALEHRAELLNLIRNLETREKAEHPLQRIMAIDEQDDKVLITTTDIHLAHGIGQALQHAYKGALDSNYNKEQYLLRVHWQR